MSGQEELENQIMHVHDLFWETLANRDLEKRFSLCSDDITFIGSGLGEQAVNKIAYQEINKKGIEQFPGHFTIEFLWKRMSHFGPIAWVESEVIWSQEINGKLFKDRIRNTTILKYENTKWLIVHVHGSVPDYRLQNGEYITNAETINRNNELERQVYERTNDLNKTLADLKSTQTQLIQSEKMASLGELTAGIAHEIQNPLNFVNNFSEINNELIDELKSKWSIPQGGKAKLGTEELEEVLNDIYKNNEKINYHGKRADAIVKGMLQHSRSSSGIKEPTDINALCEEYLRLSYHGLRAKDKSFNADFKTDFDDTIGKINVVPQDMGRVILNLLTNAFYAVAEKQKSAAETYKPAVIVSTRKIDDKIEIKVADNGTGISQNIAEKIFQPFFTTKPTGEGTGLGLSMSYDIITKGHGGALKVETKPSDTGKKEKDENLHAGETGTTFIITIPINNKP